MRAISASGRSVVALVLLWQAATWLFALPRYMLPSPVDVFHAFVRQSGFLMSHTFVTSAEILLGLTFGAVFGAATALAVSVFPRWGQLVWPMVLVLQAFPVFVLAPLLVLWFGFGMMSKVVMTSIIIFFPVASSFADGLRRTEQSILDAAALTPATSWQVLRHIRAPLAIPGLISGLRIAAPLAPLGAVIGEWVGASAGLGFVMVQANARMQTDTVFAAMSILALLTVFLRLAIDGLTAPLVPWARENAPLSPVRSRKQKANP